MKARLLADDATGRAAAIATLRAGGLVSMPTDTVYGVGVALDAPEGLERLFAAKDRPLDRAIVLLVADLDQAASVGVISPVARLLAERFWPGGLTLVLAQDPEAGLPAVLTGGAATIGVRVPDHGCPRDLARAMGPLPVTSANLSGHREAGDATAVLAELGDRIDLVLDGGPAPGGVPSTVVDCSGSVPEVLRMGAIKPEPLLYAFAEALVVPGMRPAAAYARAIRALGLEILVAASKRNAARLAVADNGDPDLWAIGLGSALGDGDPDFGWEFVCRLCEAVADDDHALSLVGSGQLEDFCSAAAPAFVDRIAAQARLSRAFREALRHVWQRDIPDAIYARIRSAADF